MPAVRSVHQRTIYAPADAVGALLNQLASDSDRLWPAPQWPAIRLDRPLGVGADGGHGPIRYQVTGYEPRRRIRFTFRPARVIDGYHQFLVEPGTAGSCVLRHELDAQAGPVMYLKWALAIRWLHDALIEDLFDNAQRATTGEVARPARWPPWVRMLRHVTTRLFPATPATARTR